MCRCFFFRIGWTLKTVSVSLEGVEFWLLNAWLVSFWFLKKNRFNVWIFLKIVSIVKFVFWSACTILELPGGRVGVVWNGLMRKRGRMRGRNSEGILGCQGSGCPSRIRNERPFGSVSPLVSAHHPAPSTYHCHRQLQLEHLSPVFAVSALGVLPPKAEAPGELNRYYFFIYRKFIHTWRTL